MTIDFQLALCFPIRKQSNLHIMELMYSQIFKSRNEVLGTRINSHYVHRIE